MIRTCCERSRTRLADTGSPQHEALLDIHGCGRAVRTLGGGFRLDSRNGTVRGSPASDTAGTSSSSGSYRTRSGRYARRMTVRDLLATLLQADGGNPGLR
jgi:hypothetical protein